MAEWFYELNYKLHEAYPKKGLKIPQGLFETINRRGTDRTMVKRKSTKRQTIIYKTLPIIMELYVPPLKPR
jgi:hypothetical protein